MYNDLLIDHFINPRNVGRLPDPDGVGSTGDPSCGDFLRIYIRIREQRIEDISFEVFGCPAAIATSSILTEMARGMTLDQALDLADNDIVEALGGLPEHKIHCSNLGAKALHEAVRYYLVRRRKGLEGDLQRVVGGGVGPGVD
ncbi:MAG: iron-sulfur cluster assembly scaffold protein [Ignavibacteriales bacterium]